MQSVVRAAVEFRPAGWRPASASARLIAVAIPVLLTYHWASPGASVLVGVGALYAGLASIGGTHPVRLRRMLATILGNVAATLVACMAASHDLGTTLLVTLGSFGLALVGATGPNASVSALLTTGILIVLTGIPSSGAHPGINALFVGIGGVSQFLTVALLAPRNPLAEERRAVAEVYRTLERFATEALKDGALYPEPMAIIEAQLALNVAPRYVRKPELGHLAYTLQVAETARNALVAMIQAARRTPSADALQELELVARALHEAREDLLRGNYRAPARLDRIQATPAGRRMAKILRHLDDAVDAPLPESPDSPASTPARRLAVGHALRLTVAIGLTTVAYRWTHMPHGFWVPLTVLFVLRQDYATTLSLGLARMLGTLLGVGIASLVVAPIHAHDVWLLVPMLAAAWGTFALYRANLVLYTAVLTAFVVFSLTASGVHEPALGGWRIGATLLGVVVALVAARIFPAWDVRQVQAVLRRAIASQRNFALALRDGGDRYAAQMATRRAITEAFRVAESAGIEPQGRRHVAPTQLECILDDIQDRAAQLMALHSALDAGERDTDTTERLEVFLREIDALGEKAGE